MGVLTSFLCKEVGCDKPRGEGASAVTRGILEVTLPSHVQEDGWDVCNKETGKRKNTAETQGDREHMIESINYTHWGNSEASQGCYFPQVPSFPPPKHSYFYTVSDLAALNDDGGSGNKLITFLGTQKNS